MLYEPPAVLQHVGWLAVYERRTTAPALRRYFRLVNRGHWRGRPCWRGKTARWRKIRA